MTATAHTGDSFSITHGLLAEAPCDAQRLGLPTGADVIRSWCAPAAYWWPRLERAIPSSSTWARGRAWEATA